MNNCDKILKLLEKNNGYVTTKEVKKNNIPNIYLTMMVNKNIIDRCSRGLYSSKSILVDNYYSTIKKSKNAVFSHATALYLHNLSDRTPLNYDITVPSGYNGSLQKDNNINLFYIKKDLLELGLVNVNSPFGMKIRVYDAERTICDIIKNKNRIDKEILSKALKSYSSLKEKDLNKLFKYADRMNIRKKVMEYMEVLL